MWEHSKKHLASCKGARCDLWKFERSVNRNSGLPDPLDCNTFANRTYGMYLYHKAMREKYERALWHPWLSLQPDPPEPADPGL